MFEKKQVFSIRKFAHGAASVLIGAFLLGNVELIQATGQATTGYVEITDGAIPVHYINYNQLNDTEQTFVIQEQLKSDKAIEDRVAFLVYQPKNKELPQTGQTNGLLSFAAMGTGLLLVAVYALRKGKKHLVALLVVGSLVSTTTLVTADFLGPFLSNQVQVEPGDVLATEVDGYRYVGYLDFSSLPEGSIKESLRSLLPNGTLDTAEKVEHQMTSKPIEQTPNTQNVAAVSTTVVSPADKGGWAVSTENLINEEAPVAEIPLAEAPTAAQPADTTEPVPTAPQPADTTEPVPTAPQPADTTEPVPTTPQPADTTEPVPTTPQPVDTTEPVPSAPQPADTTEPVPTTPQPVIPTPSQIVYNTEQVVVSIPFATEYVQDEILWEGEEVVGREGIEGLEKIITTTTYIEGVAQPEPKVETEIIKTPVNKIIKEGTKKRIIPTLQIVTFNDTAAEELTLLNDRHLDKTVTVGFNLAQDQNVVSKKYILKKNEQIVQEADLLESLSLSDLEHDVAYTLDLNVYYNTGNGVQQLTASKKFILELKKIEIKDIREYKLYKVDAGKNVRINSLVAIPTDTDQYYVEVLSDKNKPVVLPVTRIEETDEGFKISVDAEDLIERREGEYEKGHDFIFPKTKKINKANGVATFAALIKALNDNKDNANAVIELAADVSATEVDIPDGPAYVAGKFLGTLNGNGFTISDIVKPLFHILEGAKINNLVIKDADIVLVEENAGILSAKLEKNTIVNTLDVSGRVAGLTHVGGVTGILDNSTINDVTVKAEVYRTQNVPNYYRKPHNNKLFGGLAGYAVGTVNVDKAYLDVTVRSNYGSRNGVTGGVFGRLENGTKGEAKNIYVTGSVEAIGVVGRTGGYVGSGWNSTTNNHNVIVAVDTKNGNVLRSENGRFGDNVFLVVGESKGQDTNVPVTRISSAQAKEKIKELGIRVPESKNYEHKQNYDKPMLHHNMEKFLPFYNVSYVEKQAKILARQPVFHEKKILAVLPTNGIDIVSDYTGKTPITGVMVHFEDGSIARYEVAFKEDYNKNLKEYTIPELDIAYTPEGFISEDSLIIEIADILKSVNTSSYVHIDLEDQVQLLKDNMQDVVAKLLSTDKSYLSSSSVIKQELKNRVLQNKDDLLKGLSYLTRWYSIQFENLNAGDLITYNQRFFGQNVDVIDTMIRLGRISKEYNGTWNYNSPPFIDATGQSELKMAFNTTVFKNILADNLATDNLLTFLETMKNKFTNYSSMEDWFKATTKAYIQEGTIGENHELSAVGKTYEKFSRLGSELNPYILPLLTAKEGVYMIVSPAAVSVGMAEKYMDLSLKDTNPEAFKQEVDKFKAQLKRQSDHYHTHYTFWYHLINNQAKKDIERDILSVDNYSLGGQWRDINSKTQAMKDFFSPMQLLIRNNYSSAYADGTRVHFVTVDQLSDYGSAIYSHEMVHNNDGKVYFNNGGRRNNIGAEYYATGMFQLPNPGALNWDSFGLNTMYDYTNHQDQNSPTRTQALSPNSINSPEKLQSFMKNSMDVLYTLDYAEAEEMLRRSQEDKKKWYAVIQTKDATQLGRGNNSQNIRVELPDDIRLNTIDDLVRNEIISKNGYGLGSLDIFNQDGTNKYYYIRLFEPIYATGENTLGAAGDIMFRRMAFELLAYKGYTEGMLPYISNVLHNQRPAGASKVTDDFVIKKISDNTYQSMADFKIAMFQERYDNRQRLKPVSIIWNNEQIEITNYDKIRELIKLSLDKDLSENSRETKQLKNLIYSAYLKMTNDFESSIYN